MGHLLRIPLILLALISASTSSADNVIVPADISVHLSAQPDTRIVPGEPVVFTLTVVNHGPEPVNQLALISSDFYDQIDPYFTP